MSIQIYNSLTRKKEEFIPISAPAVNIYTCGVTVYDDCHIGHARSLYIFDVIRRYLEYRGFKVNFVRNITDIDDKIINRANELKIEWNELVKKYIERYYEDLNAMDIRKASFEPRATENIPEMVSYIKGLIDKGYAYVTKSGVYFNVRKFKAYGKLSGQSIEQMLTGVRKESDEAKEDPLDFALWKSSKEGEPYWESPWGRGRPGWHIECSVMSRKFLKTDTLDIHAGGRDLIFPHHENELTQAEALTGVPFAKYWIHHGLLTINNQKMAKSLGNFVTIKDFMNKYKNADLLKLLFLSAHYSHPVDYNEAKIEEAKAALQRFETLRQKITSIKMPQEKGGSIEVDFIKQGKENFINAMDDDFNMPRALSCLFDMVTEINKFIEAGKNDKNYYQKIEEAGLILFDLLKSIFGLSIISFAEGLTVEESKLLDEREEARARKDFKKSDEIRKKLLEDYNIIVEDTKEGIVYRRKS